MITGDKYRITFITDRLIRLEYQEEGIFEDRQTQMVVCRDLGDVNYSVSDSGDSLVAESGSLVLTYDKKEFSTTGLSVRLKENGNVWHYSFDYGNAVRNLKGTARTLDECDGWCRLENGIFGEFGYAIIDDSDSPVVISGSIDEYETEFANRKHKGIDLYFFGYGEDYYGGLTDFYRLCGKTPMIPRYALGNWWSRYYRYSEETYNETMDRFKALEIPLSVAVIDMDWHITDVDSKYGTGWTGYSWNRELFPDYRRFLKGLRDRNLAVTLNLHPADGVRGFEDMYEAAARKAGIDPATEQPVECDLSDQKLREAYFTEVLHPYEDDGVDFWWIDWQQGKGRGEDPVDPLFLLNHYQYTDHKGRNIRPMIFSRYAGAGSHRYPVGFSGDTVMTWRSLDFQPYFTSTASNIGYGWWSHDIGGHMMGSKDDERLIRWIEYGVFSPVMRLHSSSSEFLNKEPWAIEEPYRSIMIRFLRLRHALLPYLYTEQHRAYVEDKPLIRPMYYDHHDDPESYSVRNEYGFGDELIVGAITHPVDKELRLADVNMIIPKGRRYDILNGRIYNGDIKRKLYRRLDEIPVLLPAGGILPMSDEYKENGTSNPDKLRICIGAGANGSYTLYEDDGISMDYLNGAYVETPYSLSWEDGSLVFETGSASGDLTLVPGKRDYVLDIYGVEPAEGGAICTAGSLQCNPEYDASRKVLSVHVPDVATADGITVKADNIKLAANDHRKQVFDILEYGWFDIADKDIIFGKLSELTDEEFLKWLAGSGQSGRLIDAIYEVYCG